MEDGITKELIEQSYKLINAERRARALVDSAVASAMRTAQNIDERDFAKYAHYIALDATACLMRLIYEGDAELKALRDERDRYKQMAEKLIQTTPPSHSIKVRPD